MRTDSQDVQDAYAAARRAVGLEKGSAGPTLSGELSRETGKLEKFLQRIGLLKHITPSSARRAGNAVISLLNVQLQQLEGITDFSSLLEHVVALRKEISELEKNKTFQALLEGNPTLRTKFEEAKKTLDNLNKQPWFERAAENHLRALQSEVTSLSTESGPAKLSEKIEALEGKVKQLSRNTDFGRLLTKKGQKNEIGTSFDGIAAALKKLRIRKDLIESANRLDKEVAALDRTKENFIEQAGSLFTQIEQALNTSRANNFEIETRRFETLKGDIIKISKQKASDLLQTLHTTATSLENSTPIEKLSALAQLSQITKLVRNPIFSACTKDQQEKIETCKKKLEELRTSLGGQLNEGITAVTELVNKADTADAANAAYGHIQTLAKLAKTKEDMAAIVQLFRTLSTKEIGKGPLVSKARLQAHFQITQLPVLSINPAAIPAQFITRAGNYSINKKEDLKDAPKNPQESYRAFEASRAKLEGKKIVELTEEGLTALNERTVVVYGPAAEYVDQNKDDTHPGISDFFLSHRSSEGYASPDYPIEKEHLQVSLLANFGQTRGVVYYDRNGRHYQIQKETYTREFLYVNTPNIELESIMSSSLLIQAKPCPEGVNPGAGETVSLDHPIEYESTITPPDGSTTEGTPYGQFVNGFFSCEGALRIDRVTTVQQAVVIMTKLIEGGADIEQINAAMIGLGVVVIINKKRCVLPMELFWRMRFVANQTNLSFIESVGTKTGKNLTREVGAPAAYLDGFTLPESTKQDQAKAELMTRLDMLAVQALRKAGEPFAHLGALVVNDYNDPEAQRLWDRALGGSQEAPSGRVVLSSQVYNVYTPTTTKEDSTEENQKMTITTSVVPFKTNTLLDMSSFIWTRNQAPDMRRDYISMRASGLALEEMEALYSDMTTTQGPEVFRALEKQKKGFPTAVLTSYHQRPV